MNLRDFKSPTERRNALEKELSVKSSYLGTSLIDIPADIHCENLIGAVSIPVGVAGPLRINGESVQKSVYIPLATTEGALVASVNRGAKAITESGGVVVRLEQVGTTRGPVFEVSGLVEGLEFTNYLSNHISELKNEAKKTSNYLTLRSMHSQLIGTYVYIRFAFDTEDAMGMNMVTLATEQLVSYLSQKTKARCIALAGNFDTDKKSSYMNFLMGRGKRGYAEVTVPEEILKNTLKTTAKKIEEVVIAKCWGGSIASGALGYNAHFANITAAFFAATGQDLAHVVEGALGITSARARDDGSLVFSIMMPDIMIGTIGGGTKLKTQSEARSIMGVSTASEIAEVFVSAVLAGELSLIASLSEGTLAQVHQKLGR